MRADRRRLTMDSGAAAAAALPHLLDAGHIQPDERVVCLLTAAGFKDSRLAGAEAEASLTIKPLGLNANEVVEKVLR